MGWQDAPIVGDESTGSSWKDAPVVEEDENQAQPWFKGDPTAAMFNSLKETGTNVANKLVQGGFQGESPLDTATGMAHGLSTGAASAMVGLGEGTVNAIKYAYQRLTGANAVSDEELAKIIQNRPLAAKLEEYFKKNLGMENNASFEAGTQIVGAPFAAPIAGAEAVGGPVAGLGAELGMAGLMGKGLVRGLKRPVEAPKPNPAMDVPKTNVEAVVDRIAPEESKIAPEVRQMDMFEEKPQWQIDENGMPYKVEEGLPEPIQRDLFDPEARNIDDAIIDQGKASADKPGFIQDAVDHLNIKEGERIKQNRLGKGSFGQGGAVDFFGTDRYKKMSADQLGKLKEELDRKHTDQQISFEDWTKAVDPILAEQARREHRRLVDSPATSVNEIWPGIRVIPNGTKVRFERSVNGNGEQVGTVIRSKAVTYDGKQTHYPVVEYGDGIESPVRRYTLDSDEIKEVFSGPKKLGGTGKKGFGQGGAIDFGFGGDKEKIQANIERQIRFAAKNSASLPEFELKLKAARVGPEDRVDLLNNAQKLWDSRGEYLSKDMNVAPKDRTEMLLARDERSTNEIVKAFPEKAKDLPVLNGAHANTSSWSGILMNIMPKSPEAAQLFKAALDKAESIKETAKQLEHNVTEYFKTYNHVAPFGKRTEAKLKIQYNFGWFEKNSDKWFNGKDYYPTKEQLMDPALSDKPLTAKEADGYLAMTKVHESVLSIIDMVNAKIGLDPVRRIPGYVPHMWAGGYSFMVEATDNAGKSWHKVAKHNFKTLKEAQAALDAYKKAMPENLRIAEAKLGDEISRPDMNMNSISDYTNELRDMLEILDSKEGKFGGLKELLSKLENQSKQGVLKQSLERETNLGGHVVDKLMKQGKDNLSSKDMDVLVNLQERVHKAAVNYYKSANFTKDVWQPIANSKILADRPNLSKALEDFGDNFIGHDKTYAEKATSHIMEKVLVQFGHDPYTAKTISKFLTNAFSRYVLWGNVGFYAQNMLQWSDSVTGLFRAKALGAKGSVAAAIAKTTAELPQILAPDTLGKNHFITQEAIRMGKADAFFSQHMNPHGIQDPIATYLERRNRIVAFNVGYNFFKQSMTHEKALEAAASFSDQVMVPYEKDLGRSLLGNKLGDTASLFTTYLTHDLGRMAVDFKNALAAAKGKGDSGAITAAMPIVSNILLKWGLWGGGGLAFINNIDQMIRLWNQFTHDDVPSTKEWWRALPDEAGTAKAVTEFGAVSLFTGVDVSGSGSGSNINMPAFGVLNMMGQVLDIMRNAAQDALALTPLKDKEGNPLYLPTNAKDWNKVVKYMPAIPGIKLSAEQALQSDSVDDFVKRVMGEKPSTSTVKDSMDLNHVREPQEHMIKLLTGKNAVSESQHNTSEAIERQTKAHLQTLRQDALELLKDDQQFGNKTDDQIEKAYTILMDDVGMSLKDINKALERSDFTRNTPLFDREEQKYSKGGIGGVKKGEILDEIRAREPLKR